MASLYLSEIAHKIEVKTPPASAEDWDNVGLIVGDPAWKTSAAVISVDLTRDAINEAKRKKAKLIVTHHPPIFPKSRGLARVVAAKNPKGEGVSSLVFEALRNGIGVYTSHTNFDRCAMEVVEAIAKAFKIKPKGRLFETTDDELLKFVVYVPQAHVEKVRDAISKAGAGHIGNYDCCTFSTKGEGTFRGSENSKPRIGKVGKLEKVQEVKLETIIPRALKDEILSAMIQAHPYEEVAYDLIKVEQPIGKQGVIRGLGYGVWGEFDSPKPFSEVARCVTDTFQLSGYWASSPTPKTIKRIAFSAGSGSAFVKASARLGCDLFVTGETGYHAQLDGLNRGMAVMEIGHRESELFFLKTMEGWLSRFGLKTSTLNIPTQRVFSKNLSEE